MKTFVAIFLAALLGNAAFAWADSKQEFELSQDAYIQQALGGALPAPQRVWIRGELKQQIQTVLQHPVGFLRTKYWRDQQRSVWVLEEIGKERLITIGVTVEHAQGISSLVDVKVLGYRESRGWEVKQAFFTKQFIGLQRADKGKRKRGLNSKIDGISGATLSVRALTKVAEIALILDEHVRVPEN